jgi:hypothetical protein
MQWIASILLILLLWACEESNQPENQFVYTGPIMTTENLAISYSDSGRVIVKMSTAIQEKMQNEDEVYPKAVYVNFINDDAVEYSSLRGDSGKYAFITENSSKVYQQMNLYGVPKRRSSIVIKKCK